MSMPKFAARRDQNEQPLIKLAADLGWWLIKIHEPTDWIGCRRGVWAVIEIKRPEKEGHADEFTPKQQRFHADAKARGAPVLVWRHESDVLRDSYARIGA